MPILVCLKRSSYFVCSTPSLLSEADYKEHDVEHEPELEKPQLINLVTEYRVILAKVRKLLESMAIKVDIDSAASVLVEPEIVEEPQPKVVKDPEL